MAGVSPEEIREAFTGPAIHSNRFLVTIHPSGVRIAFSEHNGVAEPPSLRTAVLLSHQDAIELANLLTQMLSSADARAQSPQLEPKGHGSAN
jgi:hypothetical protein